MEPDGTIYDASQIVFRHRGLPSHYWHPAALLRLLADSAVMAAPHSRLGYNSGLQRQIAVRTAAARLGERNYSIEGLVRGVFGREQAGEFTRLSARVAYDLFSDQPEAPVSLHHLGQTLLHSTGISVRPEERFPEFLRRLVRAPAAERFVRKAAGWVRTADLRDLLAWKLPSLEAWSGVPEVEELEPDVEGKWLTDRFLLTYVEEWSTSSLHQEYLWSKGRVSVAVNPAELVLRTVPPEKLNAAIAQRAVTGEGGEYQRSLLPRAVELLEARNFATAAAMFEGALAVSESQWVRNCLAFCLVPIEPESAAKMLEDLLAEGFDAALVRANLAATSRLMGSVEDAWAHAAAGLDALGIEVTRAPAFLWKFGESEVYLTRMELERYLREALEWGEAHV